MMVNPDDRIVKQLVQNVCNLATVPPNETFFNCNIPDNKIRDIERALTNTFGYTVPIVSRDTIYTVTEKLKHVIQ